MTNDFEKKTIEMMMDKYINDISAKRQDEIFTVFDMINKQYQETGKCLICGDNYYKYNNVRVLCDRNYFCITNDDMTYLAIPVGNCPICGKKLGE